MSKKRQKPIFNPQGAKKSQITTLSYTFADGDVVPDHFHKVDQLVFASQGVMTVRAGNSIWVVPPLRAVWIPKYEIHSISMSSTVKMRTLYIVPKLSKAIERKCFVLNVSPLFRELIFHTCTKPAWKVSIAEDSRIIKVILDQLRSSTAIPLVLTHPKDPRAAKIVNILISDPSDPRTLGELCKGTGGSKRTIERIFLNDTGMTFGKWRQQLRLLNGMRLLVAGEKVTVAALESGYNSPSAFIAVFKKALGHTPQRYLSLQT